MRTIGRIRSKGKQLALREVTELPDALEPVNGRVELIQALIPLGLAAAPPASGVLAANCTSRDWSRPPRRT